ncbi:GGDEF domain-containing protein [Marinobacteraceae bacterium S3BR75-40.1]
MKYTFNPAAETSPAEAIRRFRHQIYYHIHVWTLAVILPLILVQARQGHMILVALLTLFALNLGLILLFLKWRRHFLFQGRTYTLFAMVCTIYSTVINDYIGLFWAYPAIAAGFFLMRPREAIPLGLLFLFIMIVVTYQVFPEAHFWRISASLALTLIYVLVFALLIGRMEAELTRMATTDPLTACLNRSQLMSQLNQQIQMRERYQRQSTLILVDLDHFKQVNDRWGHAVGDHILAESAQRLAKRLRGTDLLFRIGGEEFVVLLPETDESQGSSLANELITSVRDRPFEDGIVITASAGVAEIQQGENWSGWLKRADEALYRAKERGRNQVLVASNGNGQSLETSPEQPLPPLA